MRVVVALGGNALLQARRADDGRACSATNVRKAAPALAAIAADHELVLSHGNGPQVGSAGAAGRGVHRRRAVDARRARCPDAGDDRLRPGAGAAQRLPADGAVRDHPDDGRGRPGRPRLRRTPPSSSGRSTPRSTRRSSPRRRAGRSARTATPGAASCRPRCRSTSSSSRPIRALVDLDIVVICAGGGGIPTLFTQTDGRPFLSGVEAVIDKDLATELLAREVDADLFVMATDVDGVYADWGTPDQRRLDRVTPAGAARHAVPGRVDGPQGRGRGRLRRGHRASGPRSAASARSSRSSTARQAPRSLRPDRPTRMEER